MSGGPWMRGGAGREAVGGRRESWSREGGAVLVPMRLADEHAVAGMLARAFVDDPLVLAICRGGPSQRLRQLRWGFRVAARVQCRAGQPAWVVRAGGAGPVVAAALTLRAPVEPAVVGDGWFAVWALLRMGPGAVCRSRQAARVLARHEPIGPFTYLRTLGVDPDWQGRGFGSRLVRHVQAGARDRPPLYLETARPENVGFYQRHGFRRAGEFDCLGVRLWRLVWWPEA